jgi:hypothetical protein
MLIALVSSVSCTFVQVSFLCPIVLRAVDFSIMKNPTGSVGSEPAILGSRHFTFLSLCSQLYAVHDWPCRCVRLLIARFAPYRPRFKPRSIIVGFE